MISRSVVTACAGKHGNAAARFLHRDLDRLEVFVNVQRGTLAGGATRTKKIDSSIDLPLHEIAKGVLV